MYMKAKSLSSQNEWNDFVKQLSEIVKQQTRDPTVVG
jgi:hypothetical protein